MEGRMLDEARLLASDVMTREVAVVHPETTLVDTVKLMASRGISGLPVVDEDGTLVGMMSEGDLLRWHEGFDEREVRWFHLLADGFDLAPDFLREVQEQHRKIKALMSPNPDRGETPPPCRGTPLAVQSECRSAPSHPQAAAPGDQLGRVRCRPARSRQPDRLVHAGGGRGLGGSAAHHPRRATLLLRSGDRHGPDAASRVPPGTAPDRGADRVHHTSARPRAGRSGPLDPEPACRELGAAATTTGERAGAPAGGQHGLEALRAGGVAGRETRHQATPGLE